MRRKKETRGKDRKQVGLTEKQPEMSFKVHFPKQRAKITEVPSNLTDVVNAGVRALVGGFALSFSDLVFSVGTHSFSPFYNLY